MAASLESTRLQAKNATTCLIIASFLACLLWEIIPVCLIRSGMQLIIDIVHLCEAFVKIFVQPVLSIPVKV